MGQAHKEPAKQVELERRLREREQEKPVEQNYQDIIYNLCLALRGHFENLCEVNDGNYNWDG